MTTFCVAVYTYLHSVEVCVRDSVRVYVFLIVSVRTKEREKERQRARVTRDCVRVGKTRLERIPFIDVGTRRTRKRKG